jgi:chromosome segregation protein
LITLSNESKKLDNDYEIAQKDLDDILKNNKEIEDIYLNFSGQLTDIQNQRIQVSSEKSSKENQLEQTKTRLSNFDKKLALFNADYEASLKDRDRMQEKLDLEDEEEEKLNEELKTTIREYDEYKDRYGKTSVIVETITQNMKLLSDSLEKYSGYGSGVKNVMNKAKLRDEKALSGIHDVVANLIDFSSNTAHALEIAFGGVLQYIVVDSEADAKRAISYLNRIRGGRVTFLPIDSEKSRGKPFELPLLGGIVGWATELYSAQKVYKDIIDRFIRNVIIVKDMNVASELKQKIRGKNFRITTLAGEVFYSDGRIIGGKRERESGLLTLKNKLTTLEENLNDKKVELNELEEEFQKRFKRKDEIEKKKIEIQKRRRNLNLELDKYKEECITIGNNIKNAVENKSIEEETVDILTDQIKESTKKLNSIDKIYEGINSDNEEIKKKYEKFNKKVTEKNNEIIDIKTNIQGNEAQIKLCNSEIENLTSSIQNYDQLTEEIEGDIKFYKQEIGSFKKAIEQNTITIKKIVDKIAGISQKLEGSEEVIGKLSEEIDKKNKKKEGKNITIKEKREKLEEITDELEEFQNGKNDISVKAELYYEHLNELFDDNDDIVEYLDEIENVTDIEITNANEEINIISGKIERLGPINFEAVEEFDRFKEEYELLKENYNDIADSIEKLKDIIISVNKDIAEKFSRTIENINRHFDKTFKAMFEGGEATVIMLSPEDPLETGVDIQVKLPGKNIEVLSLTSGGEKALIAASLIFAIFLQNPSPVCILDEVDASMDAANIEKFFKMIKKFSSEIQFIVITHNKKSMEFADTLYGVTMEQKGVSKILSVHFKNKKNNDDIL